MKKNILIIASGCLLIVNVVSGTSIRPNTLTDITTQLDRYQTVSTIEVGDIGLPQVVLLELSEDHSGSLVIVDENNQQVATRMASSLYPREKLPVSYTNFSPTLEQLQQDTGVVYFDSRKSVHTFEIDVTGTQVSHLSLEFIRDMLPPQSVSVSYQLDNQWIPLVTNTKRVTNIPLGSVSAQENENVRLKVTMKSDNLIGLINASVFSGENNNTWQSIYWYAQPNTQYTMYHDSSFGHQTNFYVPSQQPLRFDEVTPKVTIKQSEANPFYDTDFDNDGIDDPLDLCPRNKDANNTDIDNNGRGDVCEDKDLDGKVFGEDNCPVQYNPKQTDSDADGIGDECDNNDDRVSETIPYFSSVLFGLVAGVLLWLVYRSRKQN